MKKWENFEDKINLALIKKHENLIKSLKRFSIELKAKLINLIHNLYNSILPYVDKAKKNINELSTVKPSEVVESIKKAANSLNVKNAISLIKYPPYKEFGKFLWDFRFNISFVLIFIFGTVNLVREIKLLAPEENSRSITSIAKQPPRPLYYLLKGRLLKVQNITIPVSLNKNKRISSIIADVVIECPNRTTQQFLYNSPHLIQDKLNNTIAPQITSFPLTEEGKIILRKKIQIELTNLLKENHFKLNQIKKVNIIQVTSS